MSIFVRRGCVRVFPAFNRFFYNTLAWTVHSWRGGGIDGANGLIIGGKNGGSGLGNGNGRSGKGGNGIGGKGNFGKLIKPRKSV